MHRASILALFLCLNRVCSRRAIHRRFTHGPCDRSLQGSNRRCQSRGHSAPAPMSGTRPRPTHRANTTCANLPPGTYRIEIEKLRLQEADRAGPRPPCAGCAEYRLRDDGWPARKPSRWKAGAPLVNTESATVSTVVDRAFRRESSSEWQKFPDADHAHAGCGGNRYCLRRPGTIQREWATRGCQLLHRGWGQRQFRRHGLLSAGADRWAERCRRSALWAGQTAWCRWMPCRSSASKPLRLLRSSDALREDRFRL